MLVLCLYNNKIKKTAAKSVAQRSKVMKVLHFVVLYVKAPYICNIYGDIYGVICKSTIVPYEKV